MRWWGAGANGSLRVLQRVGDGENHVKGRGDFVVDRDPWTLGLLSGAR
jgi:hypothetical protein